MEKLNKKKKHLISRNDLSILRKEFKETSDWNNILYILSNHFYNIGEIGVSLELANELFKNSKYYSWIWFQGKERINSFKALKNHNHLRELKKTVIKTLADDSQQFYGYLNIAREFDEIFKLVSKEVPIKTVWPAIDEFLDRLFSSYDTQDFPFPKINESETNSELPIEFQILLPLLSHHVNLISQGAYLVIHDLFCRTDKNDLIAKIINQADDEQLVLLLNILKGIIFHEPSKKSLIPVETLKQIQSNNFYIIKLAQDLLKNSEKDYIPNYIRNIEKNHTLFELTFPEPKPSRLYGTEQYDSHRILPDSDNPFENIKMYSHYIYILSKLSGIQAINLAIRANQIMAKLADKSSYGYEAEKKLQSILEAQNLKLIYRRPRALIARQAISHLISELVDIGKIKQESALMIIHDFSYIDPLLANLSCSQKPNFIQYNLPKSRIPDNWIDETINRTQLNIGKKVGSMVIIGELYETKSMDWLQVSEEIEQVLSFDLRIFKNNETIQDKGKCLYQDYYKKLDSRNTLYRNTGIYFDTKKSNWLAIHPALMNKYGMKLSKEKPFTWLSNNGKIIAQTIFWTDGIIDHVSSYGDQCSQGTICLLDKKLLNKILIENKVYLKVKRTRSYIENEEKIRKSTNLYELYSN